MHTAASATESRKRLAADDQPDSVIDNVQAASQTAPNPPAGERLLKELVNELASRLTAISSLLGACQHLIPLEYADADRLQSAWAALQTANDSVDHANQVARSTKSLVRSLSDLDAEPLTLHSVLDRVLQIIGPKLQTAAVRVRTEMGASGAIVDDSASVILALVSLIDATISEFMATESTHRQIKISTATHGRTIEIFVAGLVPCHERFPNSEPATLNVKGGSSSDAKRETPKHEPFTTATVPKNSFQEQRSELANRISRQIRGHVVVTRTERNETGYRMWITPGSPDSHKVHQPSLPQSFTLPLQSVSAENSSGGHY